MVFCNDNIVNVNGLFELVTILILVDGFLQFQTELVKRFYVKVTILILVDGFLQSSHYEHNKFWRTSHNPYFSRWFSAIFNSFLKNLNKTSHNPYFSRWFSAIN